MKRLLFIIALICSITVCSQAQEKKQSDDCYKYIIVSMVPKERGESEIKVYLDDGKIIKGSARAVMLNYFSQKGWEYVESIVVPNGSMISGMMSLTVLKKKTTQQELDRMMKSVVRH